MKTVAQFALEMADREAIRDCLFRYCRGIDRLDEELLHDVYWADAIDDHAGFVGSGDEFIEHAIKALGPMDQTMHALQNILIQIESHVAHVESYFHAFHRIPDVDCARDLIIGGRYIDRMEKRGDVWRIAYRTVMIDWMRYFSDSMDWNNLPLGMIIEPGQRKPVDRSYALLRPVVSARSDQ